MMENIFKVILVGRLDEQGLPHTGKVLVSKASIDKNLKREPLFGNGRNITSSLLQSWLKPVDKAFNFLVAKIDQFLCAFWPSINIEDKEIVDDVRCSILCGGFRVGG